MKKRERTGARMSPVKVWNDFLQLESFALMIWGTQRLAYVAIWDGYEAFVKAVVGTACPTANLRREKEFNAHFEKTFEELYAECWTAKPVNTGRVVRNALCHVGGRETRDFRGLQKDQREQFEVVEGKIQIMPTNTRTLFDELKSRVLALATKAATLAAFS